MRDRRDFLAVLGAGLSASATGCTGISDPYRVEQQDEPSRNDANEAAPVDTPGDPSATPPSNEDKVDVELPGNPRKIRNGSLPVFQVEDVTNEDANGFQTGLGDGTKDIRADRRETGISFSPTHEGTGQASGYATGTYRTAWTAPETGQYQLKATFNRWGEFRYNLSQTSEVMTSLDINAQIVNYDTSTVVANQRFPQSLQSSNQRASSAVGEFLLETAITALIGYSLGLGLVARVVLHQIVDELIELGNPGGRGTQYDVATGVERTRSPLNIGGPFKVTEDTTVVFEISPMLSWSYRFDDFAMNPQFDAGFDMSGFQVTKLD